MNNQLVEKYSMFITLYRFAYKYIHVYIIFTTTFWFLQQVCFRVRFSQWKVLHNAKFGLLNTKIGNFLIIMTSIFSKKIYKYKMFNF